MKNFRLFILTTVFSLMQIACGTTPATSQNIEPTSKNLVSQSGATDRTLDHTAFNGKAQRTRRGERVLKIAQSMLGVPYHWGGRTPRGFDCSGLVFYTHKKAGISVPRSTDQQLKASKPVSFKKLRPGDLVFFRLSSGRKTSHVGIYAGNGQFIHAPSSGKRVSYSRLDNPYWRERLLRTGRFD